MSERTEYERLLDVWLDAYLACESLHGHHGTGDDLVQARTALDTHVTRLRERAERAEALLVRLAAWDHMDTAGDGAFWREQIAAALAATRTVEPEGGTDGPQA